MKINNKKIIFYILLTVWGVLWINFIMRDLSKRGCFNDYRILIARDTEGKRSYTYGEHFYEFLKFSKERIPEGSYYDFIGLEDYSHASRRAIYFLYPCLRREDADFILVYNAESYRKDGYDLHAKLDDERFILKKKR